MDDIVEQIVEKLCETLRGKQLKDNAIFEYVDANLDDWQIDIMDFYLDDVIALACPLLKKRNALNKTVEDDGIIFKVDEEEQERNQLNIVVKHYDILYEQACLIDEACQSEEDLEELSSTPVGSWKNVLTRVDLIYSRRNT
jgi:hypothetical protein